MKTTTHTFISHGTSDRQCTECGTPIKHGQRYTMVYQGSTPIALRCGCKNWIVALTEGSVSGSYLGELSPGIRQGVTKRENAVRFTKIGAERVAKGYPSAHVELAEDREQALALAQDPRGQTAMAAQREQYR